MASVKHTCCVSGCPDTAKSGAKQCHRHRERFRAIARSNGCPCQSDVDEPGPHFASCPWSDPDYDPDLDDDELRVLWDVDHAPVASQQSYA